jgi:hypothetical protein
MASHMVGTSHDEEGLEDEKKLRHPLNKKWRQAIGSLFHRSTNKIWIELNFAILIPPYHSTTVPPVFFSDRTIVTL